MKKIGLLLVLVWFSLGTFAQETIIKEAEAAYMAEDYVKAAELYESVLSQYGESAEIYYNLGNAYYRSGRIAPSILNFERALLLDPVDADIRFNLELAKMRAVDRIEPVGSFFLIKWFEDIQSMGSSNTWAWIGIVCFIIFIGCLVLYFFSRSINTKKMGFYLGMLFLVFIILSNTFAKNQKNEILNRNDAIVFSPTVTVKSSPSNSGTDLFILHEGTKVSIKNSLGEWNEIELEDGSVGWMPKKDMEII